MGTVTPQKAKGRTEVKRKETKERRHHQGERACQSQIDKLAFERIDRLTDKQVSRQTNKQAANQTDGLLTYTHRRTDGQTGEQTWSHDCSIPKQTLSGRWFVAFCRGLVLASPGAPITIINKGNTGEVEDS